MKSAVIGFAWFLGYTLALKLVVKPVATQLNVPLVKDL